MVAYKQIRTRSVQNIIIISFKISTIKHTYQRIIYIFLIVNCVLLNKTDDDTNSSRK